MLYINRKFLRYEFFSPPGDITGRDDYSLGVIPMEYKAKGIDFFFSNGLEVYFLKSFVSVGYRTFPKISQTDGVPLPISFYNMVLLAFFDHNE